MAGARRYNEWQECVMNSLRLTICAVAAFALGPPNVAAMMTNQIEVSAVLVSSKG
jgi:hypothetical protein